MLDQIERQARLSVARGCGFAALAILTFFVGLSSEPGLAFKSAGVLALLTAAVLLIKARIAPRRPYKRTELWVMLKPDERPQEAIAQQVIGTVLRETYLFFALQASYSGRDDPGRTRRPLRVSSRAQDERGPVPALVPASMPASVPARAPFRVAPAICQPSVCQSRVCVNQPLADPGA